MITNLCRRIESCFPLQDHVFPKWFPPYLYFAGSKFPLVYDRIGDCELSWPVRNETGQVQWLTMRIGSQLYNIPTYPIAMEVPPGLRRTQMEDFLARIAQQSEQYANWAIEHTLEVMRSSDDIIMRIDEILAVRLLCEPGAGNFCWDESPYMQAQEPESEERMEMRRFIGRNRQRFRYLFRILAESVSGWLDSHAVRNSQLFPFQLPVVTFNPYTLGGWNVIHVQYTPHPKLDVPDEGTVIDRSAFPVGGTTGSFQFRPGMRWSQLGSIIDPLEHVTRYHPRWVLATYQHIMRWITPSPDRHTVDG